ncbi:MoaD/ThiS family protein [Tahibacter harae]|uniref:MoaD/ThiS family protein n=1 Tax=Tahibacter harae TaxID=2963937 RepID=A0ABT1QP77_9GAMM|nr:MoaD/ThiS family protein [Tahibacter harae]MCQ4164087.1 MoaD/ThiS family protein [Tahibacter harae]
MPDVVLASALARWLGPLPAAAREPRIRVDGGDLRTVLDNLFRQYPHLRGYVLDEQGRVRHHVAIFVDGATLRDKSDLSQALAPQSEIYLLQALSGG